MHKGSRGKSKLLASVQCPLFTKLFIKLDPTPRQCQPIRVYMNIGTVKVET